MITVSNWSATRWPNFKPEEFACSHCGGLELNERFLDRLQSLRTRLARPLIVNSGYRCRHHPLEVAKETVVNGAHVQGCAADIHCNAEDAFTFIDTAVKIGFTRIGISQRAGQPRYIHLDYGTDGLPNPRFWSY